MNERRHFISGYIAWFKYWDWVFVSSELSVWTNLELFCEKDNKFDNYAVAIYFWEHKIWYISSEQNKEIFKLLEMWYEGIFETKINQVDFSVQPERQIWYIIFLKKNN